LNDNAAETVSLIDRSSVGPMQAARFSPIVAFDRRELQAIMGLYGRMVAMGEWRDYAMDFLKDRAVFSIFRRSSEMPLYRIIKAPELRTRQGIYSIHAPGGLIMKRGNDLPLCLRVIDKPVRTLGP
jgi:Protein of unknown function (DUF2794)